MSTENLLNQAQVLNSKITFPGDIHRVPNLFCDVDDDLRAARNEVWLSALSLKFRTENLCST